MSPTRSLDPPRPVPTSTILYTDILQLVTQNETLGNISNAAVLVTGNQISWVGSASDLSPEASAAEKSISLDGCVVIPGLVNTHHHMYQSLTRCIAQVRRPLGSAAIWNLHRYLHMSINYNHLTFNFA